MAAKGNNLKPPAYYRALANGHEQAALAIEASSARWRGKADKVREHRAIADKLREVARWQAANGVPDVAGFDV